MILRYLDSKPRFRKFYNYNELNREIAMAYVNSKCNYCINLLVKLIARIIFT